MSSILRTALLVLSRLLIVLVIVAAIRGNTLAACVSAVAAVFIMAYYEVSKPF